MILNWLWWNFNLILVYYFIKNQTNKKFKIILKLSCKIDFIRLLLGEGSLVFKWDYWVKSNFLNIGSRFIEQMNVWKILVGSNIPLIFQKSCIGEN